MPPSHPLPLPRVLHALLREVTESLARELAAPGTPQPADWRAVEWSLARAVAALQGIGPLLAARGTWQGPPEWRGFLAAQRGHTEQRHERLTALLQRIERRVRAAGIGIVALKGMELHRLGLYRPGERPMADIDLLAANESYDAVAAILEELGLAGVGEDWKDHLFVEKHATVKPALGEHPQQPLKVELHRRIVERLPWRTVPLPLSLLPASEAAGLAPYPSRGSLMLHLLLHAAGGMPTRTLRMIQLHDIAALAEQMSLPQWHEVTRTLSANDLWWAYPPLGLAAQYYPASVPAQIQASFRARCPRALARRADRMRLFDVSHSYPWVEAFPGIGWSRSVGERLSYMKQRIRPGRDVLAKRKRLAVSEAWSDRDWSNRPQWQRALRFLGARQGRPSTLYAVRAALSEQA